MAIPAEKIAEVRDRADIERIVGRSVRLERRGQRLWGLCPFHGEKTASFTVSPQRRMYHCFGCHRGGDVFDFVMELEGVEFREAVVLIAREVGLELEDREEDPREREARERRRRLFDVNEVAASFFERALKNDARAWKYVHEERGLTEQTIEKFRIGWAPAEWTALVEHLDRKRIDLRLGHAVGLLGSRQSDGKPYDRLRGRVIFPIAVPTGEIAGFGARRADWIDSEGPKYLNSPESPVYDKSSILYGLRYAKDEIRRSKCAIIVEGYVDVIGLHQAGELRAVASCGTALSHKHCGMLKRHAGEIVTLYDGDAAGQDATRKAAELLLAEGLSVRVGSLPEGEDPDTYAAKVGADGVRALLDQSPAAIDFFVARAENAIKGGGIAGIAKAVESVKPLLLAVKDPLERDVYLGAAAKRLGVEPNVFRKHLAAAPLPAAAAVAPARPAHPPRPTAAPVKSTVSAAGPEAPSTFELTILRLFIESPDATLEELEKQDAIRAFENPVVQAAIDAGIEALRRGTPFDAPRALEVVASAGANEATLGILRRTLMESLPEQHDLTVCVKHLLKSTTFIRLQRLTRQIARETDPEEQLRLLEESKRLNKILDSVS